MSLILSLLLAGAQTSFIEGTGCEGDTHPRWYGALSDKGAKKALKKCKALVVFVDFPGFVGSPERVKYCQMPEHIEHVFCTPPRAQPLRPQSGSHQHIDTNP